MKIYLLHYLWEDEKQIEEISFEDFRRRFNDNEIDCALMAIYTSREDAERHANQ